VRFGPVPGKGRFKAWELAIQSNGSWARYRIDEQEGLGTTPSTVPDYLIRRQDDRAPDIAVYLDGYQFHASAEINHIARDAAQRNGIRQAGKLVWNLTWDDLRAFHDAISADPPRRAPLIGLLSSNARKTAKLTQQQRASDYFIEAIEQNPMELLLDYLYRPDREQWRNLALSAVGGMAAAAAVKGPIGAGSVRSELGDAVAGRAVRTLAPVDGAPSAMMFAAESTQGLPLRMLLDARDGRANEERWTIVSALDDSMSGDEDVHRKRWQDWLHWANVVQFLSPTIAPNPGREVIIGATSSPDAVDLDGLQLVAVTTDSVGGPDELVPAMTEPVPASARATDAGSEVELSEEMVDELSFVEDDAVRALVFTVLASGAPDFVAGAEVSAGTIDKQPVEASWPELKVGVQIDQDPITGETNTGFVAEGWDTRPVSGWTPEELREVLAGRRVED